MFKFSGFKTKYDPTLDEYVQDGLNSQGSLSPELDSEQMSLVGSSPRILELARSNNRSTPSMSSDGSNDTIEIFGELNLDDIEDDLVKLAKLKPRPFTLINFQNNVIFREHWSTGFPNFRPLTMER